MDASYHRNRVSLLRDTLNKDAAVDSAPRGHVFERCENRLIQRFPKIVARLFGRMH